MANNQYGSSPPNIPTSIRNSPLSDPEFTITRQADGRATDPEPLDRGDGEEIDSWANKHNPFAEWSPSPMDTDTTESLGG